MVKFCGLKSDEYALVWPVRIYSSGTDVTKNSRGWAIFQQGM